MHIPTQLAAVWPPTAQAARAAGHKPATPLRAIRAKCLDCSCYQLAEVPPLRGHWLSAFAVQGRTTPWHGSRGKPPSESPGFEQGGPSYAGPSAAPKRNGNARSTP